MKHPLHFNFYAYNLSIFLGMIKYSGNTWYSFRGHGLCTAILPFPQEEVIYIASRTFKTRAPKKKGEKASRSKKKCQV